MVQQVITVATAALLEWLDEGWIRAKSEWNVDRAQVEVSRDWYAPYWIVTFTIERAPWFGDSINVDVQELGYNHVEASIDATSFADENILCWHRQEGVPDGHWEKGR